MIAPAGSAEFVPVKEDALDVYTRKPDPARPSVGLDECARQLTCEARAPRFAAPADQQRLSKIDLFGTPLICAIDSEKRKSDLDQKIKSKIDAAITQIFADADKAGNTYII